MTCNICRGNKRVRMPTYAEAVVISGDGGRDDFALSEADPGWEEFDCPKCTPMVPYRRVRATKVTTAYPAEEYGKFQVPIERGMAARFGEYLLREGLIRFTTKGSTDFGVPTSKITITAHLGVVSREDVAKSGAVPEVALSPAPKVADKLARQRAERLKRVSARAVPWEPKPWDDAPLEPVTDEFDEPKDAIAGRFSGLEI